MKNNPTLAVTFLLVINLICNNYAFSQFLKGNGKVEKKERPVSSFHTVEIQDGIDLFITQGLSENLVIEADENLHQYIKTELADGILKINLSKMVWKSQSLKVHLTIKNIKALSASGGSDVESVNLMKLEELSVICSGGSDANLNIEAAKLKFKASGGSDGFLKGTVKTFLGKASGGSDIKAFELNTVDSYIEVTGGSDAEISVNGNLNVSGSGGSDVSYKGKPVNIDSQMSGGSSLYQK